MGKIFEKINRLPFNLVLAIFFATGSIFLLQLEREKHLKTVLGWENQIKKEQQEAYHWEEIVKQRPDWRDGWLQLATYYLRLNYHQKAKEAVAKAKELDPNNPAVIALEKYLE
jgi:cytochrome c-type biogenesis protein CcmH/NrfG